MPLARRTSRAQCGGCTRRFLLTTELRAHERSAGHYGALGLGWTDDAPWQGCDAAKEADVPVQAHGGVGGLCLIVN